ncbi:unnamed protein product [Brassicogethes aeneus]|uniref:Dynein regulatory complex protein 1 n=1 Tax=Brassicogethes aeneus TaxID=1431903 RepID=A0A9P0FQ89_BRAAE|nr:unnamed protein product [Brassicogethes aeneus]
MMFQEENDVSQIEREPRVTSMDPNERKLARKMRIQRRLEAIKKKQIIETEGEDYTDNDIKNSVQQQILRSFELLEKYINQGDEYITNVRIANDSREVDRREREGLGREQIIQSLEEESKLAEDKFNEIADKWSEVLRYNDPLLINDSILEQKERGNELLAQKDALIASLKLELRNAEREFSSDQRKQIEDITTLTSRIEKQLVFMRKIYNQELNNIEKVMLEERDKLLAEAQKRWEDLYKERDLEEAKNSDAKLEALERYQEQIEILRRDFQELYRGTKIRVEHDIEDLQKELESIKALTLLNNGKLDYNYQILKKREDENIRIKAQQKRKLNQLRDLVINLRKKNKDYEENSLATIKKLEEDIKKLNACILEVESKADHFASINDRKFDQILAMNKLEVEKLLQRIKEVDQIIHVQQMGEPWVPFEINIRFHYYENMRRGITMGAMRGSVAERRLSISDFAKISSKGSGDSESFVSLDSQDIALKKTAANMLKEVKLQEGDTENLCALVKDIMRKLADNTGFLAEEKLMEILTPYTNVQKTVVMVDNTFVALGIKDKDDMNLLVQYFLPYTWCPECCNADIVDDRDDTASAKSATMIARDRKESVLHNLGTVSKISQLDYTRGVEFCEENLMKAIQDVDSVIPNVVREVADSADFDDLNLSPFEDKSVVSPGVSESQPNRTTRFAEKVDTDNDQNRNAAVDMVHCAMFHPLSISPVHVLTALKNFVTAFYSGNNQIVKPTIQDRLDNKRETVSRQLPHSEIKRFWLKYKTVFPEEKKQLWKALLRGLIKYHEILKQRKLVSLEVVHLRGQNKELKQILSNYLHHGKAMDPPCGEMRESKFSKGKCIEKR